MAVVITCRREPFHVANKAPGSARLFASVPPLVNTMPAGIRAAACPLSVRRASSSSTARLLALTMNARGVAVAQAQYTRHHVQHFRRDGCSSVVIKVRARHTARFRNGGTGYN